MFSHIVLKLLIILIIINLIKKTQMSLTNHFLPDHRSNINHMNYYYFTDAFTPEEILKIIEIGENLQITKATTVGSDNSTEVSDYRISEISWIDETEETSWIYEKISNYAKIANKEMWNFDIWGYQDSLQYTKYYGNGGHYDWHADLGPGLSNRKLSVVLQLSDPGEYEGGELQMNIGGSILTVPKELGLICFFPSFLLHRVTPLTSGVRTSMVTWLCGANLR
jgi:PKHD-type hydroxylase